MRHAALSDERARERIATDLDANLCIEAGAGTGKTSVLVKRVVNLLASGRVRADELVVITFTEKAAAELAARVRDELEAHANTAEDEERERLLAAAHELYRAHIETIHSFAAALLRERPVEAEIDPLFEVLDELAAGLEFDRAFERFQDALLSQPLPELERALRRGFGLGELREACEYMNTHRYLVPLALPDPSGDELGGLLARFHEIAVELGVMLREHEPGEDTAVEYVEGIIDWVARVQKLAPAELERHVLFKKPARTHLGKGSNAAWHGEKERMKQLQVAYREAVTTVRRELRTGALLGLLPHIADFVESHAKERKEAGQADYDDLLFWARDLLRHSRAARDYFRRRFRTVLIDEFQDTDPVQAELALLLTSDEEPEGDWRELRPVPGRLTVVGDPKQSIYRFRRADIVVYDQVKRGALADGQEQISTNFRSSPELLKGLNAAFDHIFKPEEGVQPANVSLNSPPNEEHAKRAPVVLAEGATEGVADVVREEEARVIAALLWRAHSEGWEIRDRRRDNEWRKCRWGDMAILLPARTGLEHYEEALVDAGIPYRHEGSRDFFERQEVRDLIWVLSAIDDPTDRVALIGALRSSAFAVSDEELVLHAAGGGALSYRAPATGPSEPVNEAFAELADLHRLRRGVSLAELVRRVVERTWLVEFALTRPDGEQGAANLLAIIEDARLFSAASGGGLRPFIRYLRDSMDNEAIEIDATVAEETDDVVRIMTMHGAKGLEYPIVALANLGSERSAEESPVPRESESFLHFSVGTYTRTGHFTTPGYEQVWEGEKQHVQAERLRLLYVAATRARDHLLVPCVVGRSSAKHLLGELVSALPDDASVVTVLDASELAAPHLEREDSGKASKQEVDAAVAERSAWAAAREDQLAQAGSERDIETASSRERAYGPLAAEVMTFEGALLVHDGPPIPVGDAVHMVMERITLPDAKDLVEIAEDVCLEGDIAEELDDVIAMCRACLDANSVKQAVLSERLWREVPFVVSRDGAGAPDTGPLASGRVDLVYKDDDQLVVIDYKTDKDVTAESAETHAREHHSGQAEIYSQALASATGLCVREVVFVYCKAGVEVRLRPNEDHATAPMTIQQRVRHK